jgi:hypothetical protein
MAFPDCECAPDKFDLRKKGCQEQAKFAVLIYTLNDAGRVERVYWPRVLWTCRTHAKQMYAAVLGIALEFKRIGEKGVKVTLVALENGPVSWTGNTETFGAAVEAELRRRYAGL